MTISINYKNSYSKKTLSNNILFVDEKYTISSVKKHITISEYTFISDLIKTKDIKKKFLTFDLSSKKKIILVALKKNISYSEVENLGAKFYESIKNNKQSNYFLNSDSISIKLKNIIGHFLHGLRLKSYSFEKYKTKKSKISFSRINYSNCCPSFNTCRC